MPDHVIAALTTEQPSAVEYRDVPCFPGYRVGNDGSVWTCRKPGAGFGRTGEWKRMIPTTTDRGRLVVHLSRDRQRCPRQVHALVMLAFVGPYPDGMEICHENGAHTDNHLSNLRYDTHAANEADKARHGRKLLGDRHPVAKLTVDSARAVKAAIRAGRTLLAIAEEFGVSKKTVLNIKQGKAWSWVN